MAFDCDFNAPMFVDFDNIDNEPNPDTFFDVRNQNALAASELVNLKENSDENVKLEEKPALPAKAASHKPPPLPKKTVTASSKFLAKISMPPASASNSKPFVSLAEETLKFHQKCPERFLKSTVPYKRRSASADRVHTLRKKSPSPICFTEPMSPKLRTRSRSQERRLRENTNVPPSSAVQTSSKMDVKSALKKVPHKGIPLILHQKMRSVKRTDEATKPVVAKVALPDGHGESSRPTFKAKPMPNFVQSGVKKGDPLRNLKSPMKAKPFNFQTANRARCKMTEDMMDKAKVFRAQGADVLVKKPFVAKPSDRSPVKALDIELHTETRLNERKNFDEYIKQKEAELQAVKRQEEERQRQQEERNVREMRKAAVHKAQPIRHYLGVTVKASDKPVTQPFTPKFSKRVRHKSS